MKRVIDLPDELAQSLDTYLQEHPEETFFSLVKEALENKLTSSETKPTWEKTLERIEARRKTIHARTGGKPFKPSVTEIIHQMRDERDEQLMQACCPQDDERPRADDRCKRDIQAPEINSGESPLGMREKEQ